MLSAMYHTFVSHLKLYSEIRELNPRPKTVYNCHYLIKRKLGVAGDIELTRLAIRLNVISLLDLTI